MKPILIGFSLFLSSCISFHSGSVSSGPLLHSSDQYSDIASGTSRSVFVLGFGNSKKIKLVQEAKKNLYLFRPLHKNEYYANFTTDINKKIIFFVAGIIDVSVSADVLKSNDTTTAGFSNLFNSKIKPGITINNNNPQKPITLLNGDSVYYSSNTKNYNLYTVSSLDKQTAVLNSVNPAFKNTLVPIAENTFFIKTGTFNNFKAGDKLETEVFDKFYNTFKKETCIIYGFSENTVLVKNTDGFYIIPREKLKK